jgi:hypothetical protein
MQVDRRGGKMSEAHPSAWALKPIATILAISVLQQPTRVPAAGWKGNGCRFMNIT